jgi:hypothetical protein
MCSEREVILALFDSFLHHFSFQFSSQPLSCNTKVSLFRLEIADKPAYSTTRLIDVSHYSSKSTAKGKEVILAVLSKHFYNDTESDDFMPALPLTTVSMIELAIINEQNTTTQEAPTRKFITKDPFSKTTPGLFNVENLHPTSNKLFCDGDGGILIFSAYDISYYDKNGRVSVYSKLTEFCKQSEHILSKIPSNNSCLSLYPCDVRHIVRTSQPIRDKLRIFTQVTEQLLVLYSDQTLHLITLQRKKSSLNKQNTTCNISHKTILQSIPLGQMHLLKDTKVSNLYMINAYQSRPQDHWIDIHRNRSLFDRAVLQTEMAPYFSAMDEQQQVSLGPIASASIHQDTKTEPKLVCCANATLAICQMACRLIPHDLLRKDSLIQGNPELYS